MKKQLMLMALLTLASQVKLEANGPDNIDSKVIVEKKTTTTVVELSDGTTKKTVILETPYRRSEKTTTYRADGEFDSEEVRHSKLYPDGEEKSHESKMTVNLND